MDCWICGQPGDSAEHLMKVSDLRSAFGVISQVKPLYVHSKRAKNARKRTVRDDAFKSKALLCSTCNNSLSQPYDRAWERLSAALRELPALRPKQLVRLDKIYPHPRASMLDVHLFFLKLFGCRIAEEGIPIDIRPFAEALVHRKSHPGIFIAIGPTSFSLPGKTILGWTEISVAQREDGSCAYAQWFYHVQNVAVLIMYAEPGEHRQGLAQAWHPSTQGRLLQMARFA